MDVSLFYEYARKSIFWINLCKVVFLKDQQQPGLNSLGIRVLLQQYRSTSNFYRFDKKEANLLAFRKVSLLNCSNQPQTRALIQSTSLDSYTQVNRKMN